MNANGKGRLPAATIREGIKSECSGANCMNKLLKATYMSLIGAIMFSGSSLLIGCNTAKEGAHGAGQDLKDTGQGLKNAGEKVKEKTE